MRINNNIMADNMLNNLQQSMQRLYKLENQLSTGKKFQKPSDDVVATHNSMRINEELGKLDRYLENIEGVLPYAEFSESILASITEQMNNAETLATQYQNDSQTENRSLIAENVNEILDNVIDLANSSYSGKYVFGGYNTSQVPFVIENDKIRYMGTDDTMLIRASENDTIAANIAGSDIFTVHQIQGTTALPSSTTVLNPEPSTNMFSIKVGDTAAINVTVGAGTSGITLESIQQAINTSGAEAKAYIVEDSEGYRLKIVSNFVGEDGQIVISDNLAGGVLNQIGLVDATNAITGTQTDYTTGSLDALLDLKNAMRAGNTNVTSEKEAISSGRENIIKSRSIIGIIVQDLESRKSMLTDFSLNKQEQLSAIEDIDYAEVMTELNKEMMAYQSAIQAGARIVMPSLLDYV